MGSGLDPVQLGVSKDSTFLPTQIMELNAEEARYATSHLHIKYNLFGEAIAELSIFFYCNTNELSTKSGPLSSVHTREERETIQPDVLKPSTDSSPLIPLGTSPLQINYFLQSL